MDWVPYLGQGAAESCDGAKGILITHRSVANGREHGTYVVGDTSAYKDGAWRTIPGFHYTTVRGGPYLFDRTATPSATGNVDFIWAGNAKAWYFIPLYMAGTTNPLAFSQNAYVSTGWTVDWIISGCATGSSEDTVFTAYKKK